VTLIDWLAVGLILLLALAGMARGLIAGALSVVGVAGGAVLGARLAPLFLPDGAQSPWTPVAALGGAVLLAVLLEGVASAVGSGLRARLRFKPVRALDSFGGLALGAATALAVVWVLGVVALQVPGQTELRRAAQRSVVVRELTELVPPADVLNALARVDPFPQIVGPLARVDPPEARIVRTPGVRRASRSVVRVLGTACGLGVAGSGWIAGPRLVVTAAHVVAGQRSPSVQEPGELDAVATQPVAYDSTNDVAVLRVPAGSLAGRPLSLADPDSGTPVAIVGYPEGEGLTAAAGRIGQTTRFLADDAYGDGPLLRTITTVRGEIRQGNSGGPAVDAQGRVRTTVFAARVGSDSGYGVPTDVVRRALSRAGGRSVSTGPCAR
jgi:S1-C subfamily serine protease